VQQAKARILAWGYEGSSTESFITMNQSKSSGYHLVHANVAHARAPLDSALMAGFVSQVDEINLRARATAGFVALPTLPDAGAVYTVPLLLNVSIWESIESLDAFTHQGTHATALERRDEWFEQHGTKPSYVLFWIPKGHIVTEKEIKERLDYLGKHGATPYAFTFKQPFRQETVLSGKVVGRVRIEDLDAALNRTEAPNPYERGQDGSSMG
jgi:hypothetical protein